MLRLIHRTLARASIFCRLCVLLVPLTANAQNGARPMAFEHLTVTEGLSQATVMDVLQDSVGYMWFATENGLDRYDGHSVHSYLRGSPSRGELANDYIWALDEDNQQNLWLATNGGGLARWRRSNDTFDHFRHDPQNTNTLSSDRLRSVLVGKAGIWVATTNRGLNLLNRETGRVQRFRHDPDDPTSLPSDGVYALLEDSQGRLWAGTDAGLAWLQPGTRRFTRLRHDPDNPQSLSNDRVRALFQDRHGGIWIGTFGGGLNLLDRRTGRVTRFVADADSSGAISDNHVREIMEDDAGRIWVATANGLNMLKPYSDSFAQYFSKPEASTLRDNYIMSLYQDNSGVLWVGTRTGGVSRWNARSWYFGHTKPAGAEDFNVTSFTTSPRHRWIGTFGGGVVEFDKATNTIRQLRYDGTDRGLPDDRVMSLLADRSGGLWVGTMEAGVSWRPPGATRFRRLEHIADNPQSLSAAGAMSLFEDSRGDIWIGTFGGGMTRFTPATGRYKQFSAGTTPRGFCGEQGRAVIEDRHGILWMGTENGLCAFDPRDETFTALRHRENDPQSLGANSIYGLHEDSSGNLWVGTGGGGLSRLVERTQPLSASSFHTVSRADGLSSATIFGILSDHEGQLWMSGNNGLMRYNPAESSVRTYHLTHGLQGEEFHFGATHRGYDGRMYFGGANGYNEFDPQQLYVFEPLPSIVLSSVLVLNQEYDAGEPLSSLRRLNLSHDDKALTLEFTALAYTEPQTNRYRYRLEGFEDDWVEADTRRAATYTNLPAGRYVFRAEAATSTGQWNSEGISLDISVAPPPWASRWAYGGYTVGLLLAIWFAVRRLRLRARQAVERRIQLEREVQKRTEELNASNLKLKSLSDAKGEFLARMSHEIRSPINGVLGMAELLARTDLNVRQKRFNETIRASTLALLDIVNDVLDYSKLESAKMTLDPVDLDVEKLVDEVLALMAAQAQAKGIELIADMPATGLPLLKCDPMRMRQVLVNLVNNALKFTEHGSVTVSIEPDKQAGSYRFTVADTGIGIAAENQLHIFESFAQEDSSTSRRYGGTGLGLSICKQIVELMGGELYLASEQGMGTTFSFALMLEAAGPDATPYPPLPGSVALITESEPLSLQVQRYCEAWDVSYTRIPASSVDDLSSNAAVLVDSRTAPAALTERLLTQLPSERLLILHSLDADAEQQGAHQLSLPLTRRTFRDHLEDAINARPPTKTPGANMTTQRLGGSVLLVEDNEVNQEVFRGMLAELGCDTTVAADGFSALEAVAHGQFDIILMDYRLPDIDGIETTERIRRLQTPDAKTPIVALTANTSTDDRNRCLNAGMDGFLAKPCTLEALARTLSNWLTLADPDTVAEPATVQDSRFDRMALTPISRLKTPAGENMLDHAVRIYLRTAGETLQMMQNAMAAGDDSAISFSAHKLKSACANLGILHMANLCKQLESTAAAGSTADAAELIDELHTEQIAAEAWLQKQVESYG